MAEINRSDLFSDDAINAPKELAKNLMDIVASINAITAASKKSEEQLKTSNSASKITKETEQLTIQEKELIKVQNQISVALAKNNEEYIESKRGLDAINKTLKDKISLDKSEEGSINQLVKANKELIKERNKISDKTKEGAQRIVELNAKINENTNKIKSNVSALEKQKMNIGNYSSALEGVSGKLGDIIPGLKNMTGGLSGMGIGLTALNLPLAAVMLAVNLFSAAISKSEPILDFFEDWFTKTSAVVASFVDNISAVGNILKLIVTGEFAMAAAGVKKLGATMGEAADESMVLLNRTRDLEDAEMKYRLQSAAAANQIKAWVTASKNKDLSIEESNALLQKASDLENEMTEVAVKNAQERADIEEALLVRSKRNDLEQKNMLRKAGQSQKEYIDQLVDSGIFSPQQLEPLISAYEKVEQEASAGWALQEKILNSQAALRDKDIAGMEKRRAEMEKNAEAEAKSIAFIKDLMANSAQAKYDAYKKENELREQIIKKLSEFTGQELKLNTSFNDAILAAKKSINKEIEEADQESFEKRKSDHEQMLEDTLALYMQFSGAIGNLLSGITASQMQDLELQKRANKDKLEKDLVAAGDNEAWKERLKLRSAATDERLAAEQLRLKQRQARYDKATALFGAGLNTALAITKAIPNPVLIALSAALGAIQVAAIAAKPIPAFAKGTSSAPGGMALVGELGRELLVSPRGSIGVTPDGPTVMNLQKGTEVIPNKETLNMLAMAGLGRSQNVSSDYSITNELRELQRSIKDGDDRIVKAISNTDIDFISQGSLLYKMKKSQDGNRLKVRKKIM